MKSFNERGNGKREKDDEIRGNIFWEEKKILRVDLF